MSGVTSASSATTSPSLDAHVAIIGGGIAGVATCKALSVRGIACTVFDSQPRVGGLWVANYPGADVQAPHSQYEYADAPLPTPMHGRASAAEVVAYCEAYVKEWGLEGCLRLGTRVERVSQRAGGGFTVTTRPAHADSDTASEEEEATHVVVCTGIFSANPCMPEFPGLDTFAGLVLHSSQRRDDGAELRSKRVLVVGGGKSAQEAAAAALRAGATSVTLALRQPHLLVPFRLFGLVPYHWVFANPVVQKLLPVYPGRRPLPPLGRLARAVTAPVRGLLWRTLKVVMLLHYRLPVRLWPRQSLEFEVMGSQGPSIYSRDYIRGARSGKIDVRVAEVAAVHPHSVTLRHHSGRGSDTAVPVDTIVLGTGFVDGHPFLDSSIQKGLDRQPDGLPLYRHIVPPQLPGVFFIGRAASFTNPLTASVQAAWLGELLCGRVALPSAADMRADTDRWAAALAAAPLSSARRHLIALQGDRYSYELLQDMGVAHLARYGGLFGPVANAVMPQNPENYSNAVQPPAQRTRHRLRPPLWLMVATGAVVAGAVEVVRHALVQPSV